VDGTAGSLAPGASFKRPHPFPGRRPDPAHPFPVPGASFPGPHPFSRAPDRTGQLPSPSPSTDIRGINHLSDYRRLVRSL
jgi:hypothetical protein